MTHILYLHGFLSSEQSVKAVATQRYFSQHHPDVVLHTPRLSNYPARLQPQLEALVAQVPELVEQGGRVIGSSMGGFLATWLTERFGGKAVLINPAVRPYELLRDYLGEHQNPYTSENFTLVPDDIDALIALDTPRVTQPENYRVLLQTGDETLNYQEAESKYAGSDLVIEQGGDHSFTTYASHLTDLASFLMRQ